MSQSPMSPAGKRLRIMSSNNNTENDVNHHDDDEDGQDQAKDYWTIWARKNQPAKLNSQQQQDCSSQQQLEQQPGTAGGSDWGETSDNTSRSRLPCRLHKLYRRRRSPDDSDTDTDSPRFNDDDDDDFDEDQGGRRLGDEDSESSSDGDNLLDNDDRSEDYEDIGVYDEDGHFENDHYNDIFVLSDTEESSGYQDYNGVGVPADYEVEDDSLDQDSDEDEDDVNQCLPDEYLKHDPTPDTLYPRPDWITSRELRARRLGFASSKHPTKRPSMSWFERYATNSLYMIQRLQLEKKLQGHTGCIQALDFNSYGNLLCSAGDDLSVCIYDWREKSDFPKSKLTTSHVSNIFESLFCNGDAGIVTSSRDGTVRLTDVETGMSEVLLSSSGEIGNISFVTHQTMVTCGTNACVNLIDLRTKGATRLFVVRSPKNNRSCPLHSINSHPLDKDKIVVAGSSPYVFLYDLRRISRDPHDTEHKPAYCLGKFENTNHVVTSTAFNSTGEKLLISYNDDDLYVCRTDTCKIVHRYRGHRNKKTIKGCTWFGDNYVMSGSDDGHIYGWDLDSEHIVCFLEADTGVVNRLKVHPDLPVLASSGFDHDVKVWEPISSTWPQTLKGIKPQICKNTMRRKRAYERRIRPTLAESGDDASDNDL